MDSGTAAAGFLVHFKEILVNGICQSLDTPFCRLTLSVRTTREGHQRHTTTVAVTTKWQNDRYMKIAGAQMGQDCEIVVS